MEHREKSQCSSRAERFIQRIYTLEFNLGIIHGLSLHYSFTFLMYSTGLKIFIVKLSLVARLLSAA